MNNDIERLESEIQDLRNRLDRLDHHYMTKKMHWGKHRGIVVDNKDPEGQGRICVRVPGVSVSEFWAMPCMPYQDPQGDAYLMPAVGAAVWVEFEGGRIDSPIWVGHFWRPEETPKIRIIES